MDNFLVRFPPDPPINEFASLTRFLIGRGAVAPSQTLPGGLETVWVLETAGGYSMEKSKDSIQEGGTIRAVAFGMGRGDP